MNAQKIYGENVYVNLDEVIETVYQCRADVADREWEKRWLEPLMRLERKEVSEWIPCSERLPHAEYGESDNVLVTCESKYIRLLYFNGGNWCYPTGEYYEHRIDKVVAWMPLPEPWKGAAE